MAKIKIPRLEDKFEEFSVEEDDIILVMRRKEKKLTNLFLGVFSGFSADQKSVRISQPYILRPCEFLGVGFHVPMIQPIQGDYTYGRIPPLTNLAPEERFYYFKIRGLIEEIHSGKDDIVRRLENLAGYEAHTDWIKKLQKPYLAEKLGE